MDRENRTRAVTAVVLALVFGSGVLLGFAVDGSLSAESSEAVEPVGPGAEMASAEADARGSEEQGASEARPEGRRRNLYHQVDPNEQQLARIETLVAEYRSRRDAFDAEARARFETAKAQYEEGRRDILLDLRDSIKAVLTPEQAVEYQRLLDEWDARRAAERENEDDRD